MKKEFAMKAAITLVLGIIVVIYGLARTNGDTVAYFFSSPASSAIEDSFEDQLLAGADPTELLDATAAGAKQPDPLHCDDLLFGQSDDFVFVRKYGDSLYVAKIDGFKAFQLDQSGYYATQVAMSSEARLLSDAFQRCKQPAELYEANVSFYTE
jgi:hypothetical protein